MGKENDTKSNELKGLEIPTIDASGIGLVGNYLGREVIPGRIGIFPDPMIDFTADQAIVSHEGNTDFQIHFADYSLPHNEYKISISLIFSNQNIDRFLTSLKNLQKKIKYQIHEKKLEETNKLQSFNDDVKKAKPKARSFITEETEFYAPNEFLSFLTTESQVDLLLNSNLKIYFGRNIGNVEILEDGSEKNKPAKTTTYYKYSIKMSLTLAMSLINTIELNIKRFEETNKLRFADLLIDKKAEDPINE